MNEKARAFARFDYFGALADYGVPYELASAQAANMADYRPIGSDKVEIGSSEIAGKGLFAAADIEAGEIICLARVDGYRSEAGKYTNHSPRKNAKFVWAGDDITMISVGHIMAGDEITVDYRDSLALQIERPRHKAGIMGMSMKGGVLEVLMPETPRHQLSGLDAAAYDLLFNEGVIKNMTLRDRVLAFESITEQLPQIEVETEHEFIDGLYRRQVTFKAGTLATGKIHPVDHMDVMLSGEMIVASEDGFKHLKAPLTLTSRAYAKKAGYAIKDTVWVTYHPTSSKTVKDVEKEIFVDGFNEITGYSEVVK